MPGNQLYPGVDKLTKQPGGLVCLYGSWDGKHVCFCSVHVHMYIFVS